MARIAGAAAHRVLLAGAVAAPMDALPVAALPVAAQP